MLLYLLLMGPPEGTIPVMVIKRSLILRLPQDERSGKVPLVGWATYGLDVILLHEGLVLLVHLCPLVQK